MQAESPANKASQAKRIDASVLGGIECRDSHGDPSELRTLCLTACLLVACVRGTAPESGQIVLCVAEGEHPGRAGRALL